MAEVKCPHCKEFNTDIEEVFDGSDDCVNISCGICGKEITICKHISVSYNVYKVEDK